MKLIEKYTDEYYASNYEIQDCFHIGSQIIMESIERYRDQYRIYFYYQEKKISLVLTPKIKHLLNELYEHDTIEELHPYLQVFVLRNEPNKCIQCMIHYQLPLELMNTFDYLYSFEEDMTKSFLEWLEHLKTYSFIKMIHYAYKIKHLSKKQLIFFYEHPDYFPIEEYQQSLELSYETSRLHLVEFYKKGIVHRYKVGKRYIYKGGLW